MGPHFQLAQGGSVSSSRPHNAHKPGGLSLLGFVMLPSLGRTSLYTSPRRVVSHSGNLPRSESFVEAVRGARQRSCSAHDPPGPNADGELCRHGESAESYIPGRWRHPATREKAAIRLQGDEMESAASKFIGAGWVIGGGVFIAGRAVIHQMHRKSSGSGGYSAGVSSVAAGPDRHHLTPPADHSQH